MNRLRKTFIWLISSLTLTAAAQQAQLGNRCDQIMSMDETTPLLGFCGPQTNPEAQTCAKFATEMHDLYREFHKFRQGGGKAEEFRSPKLLPFYQQTIANLTKILELNQASKDKKGPPCVTLVRTKLDCDSYIQALTTLKFKITEGMSPSPRLGDLNRLLNVYEALASYDSYGYWPGDYHEILHGNKVELSVGHSQTRGYAGWPYLAVPSSHRKGVFAEGEFNAISHIRLGPIGLVDIPQNIDGRLKSDGTLLIQDHIEYASHDSGHAIIKRPHSGETPLDAFRCGCQINDIMLGAPADELKTVNQRWFERTHELLGRNFSSRTGLLQTLYNIPTHTAAKMRERAEKLTENCFSSQEEEEKYKKKVLEALAAKAAAEQKEQSCTKHNPQGLAGSAKDLSGLPGMAMREQVAKRFAELNEDKQNEVIDAATEAILASRAPHLEQLQTALRNAQASGLTKFFRATVGAAATRAGSSTLGLAVRRAGAVVGTLIPSYSMAYADSMEFWATPDGINLLGTPAAEEIFKRRPETSDWVIALNHAIESSRGK